jgi:hypothetical protein
MGAARTLSAICDVVNIVCVVFTMTSFITWLMFASSAEAAEASRTVRASWQTLSGKAMLLKARQRLNHTKQYNDIMNLKK